MGKRKPRDLPQFKWVNTILGNLKTMINGGYKAFAFAKCACHYLGAFAYRFNRRFDLAAMLRGLIGHAAAAAPRPEWRLRFMPKATLNKPSNSSLYSWDVSPDT